MTGNERELGQLSTRITSLEDTLDEVRKDVREIRDAVLASEASRKTIGTVSAIIGGLIGAGIVKIAPFIGIFPK